MQEKLKEDEFKERLAFSDETTFCTNGKVNWPNVGTWGEENPHAILSIRRTQQKWMCSVPSPKTILMAQFFWGKCDCLSAD